MLGFLFIPKKSDDNTWSNVKTLKMSKIFEKTKIFSKKRTIFLDRKNFVKKFGRFFVITYPLVLKGEKVLICILVSFNHDKLDFF